MTGVSLRGASGSPDADPNWLYIAVSRVIGAWDGVEGAFTDLFLTLTGVLPTPKNRIDFQSCHPLPSERRTALQKAGSRYFLHCTDRIAQGEFAAIMKDFESLAVVRHLVAQGHVTAGSALPSTHRVEELSTYRWANAFTSIERLGTDPEGMTVADIELLRERFDALACRTRALCDTLA